MPPKVIVEDSSAAVSSETEQATIDRVTRAVGAASEINGEGYDSFRGETRGAVLEKTRLVTPIGGGTETIFRIDVLSSYSSLRETMELSVSTSFAGLGWGASASASWARSRSLNSTSVYLSVIVRIHRRIALENKTLRSESKSLLVKNPHQFFVQFGDRYIAEYKTGGMFVALYEFSCQSAEEHSSVTKQLKGGVGIWSASADFKSTFDSITTSTATRITYHVLGLKGGLPKLSTDEIIKFALGAPENVDGEGALVGYVLEEYTNAERFEGKELPFRENRLVYTRLADARDRVSLLQNDVQFVVDNREFFGQVDVETLKNDAAALGKRIDDVAGKLVDNPTVLAPPSSVEAAVAELEKRQVRIAPIEYGPVAGPSSGQPFDDGIRAEVRRSRRISSVTVRHGSAIDAIEVSYDRQGQADFSAGRHGGDGGGPTTVILNQGEHLTSVSGDIGSHPWGSCVSRLRFVTNAGRTFGPYGEARPGGEFSFTAPDGHVIMGFSGYSGKFLFALGPIFTRLPERA